MNNKLKQTVPAFLLTLAAITGCDGQDGHSDDVDQAVNLDQETSLDDPFAAEVDSTDAEFRGASTCKHECRRRFSSCLAGCSFIPRHGFIMARDEGCMNRCESALAACNQACDAAGAGKTVQGPCFNFTATASGGLGGFRVLDAGAQEFFRFNSNGRGRICTGHGKRVRFDVEKMLDKNIDVTVTVQGKKFHFRRGDSGNLFHNSWYRKYFPVYVR